MSPKLIACIGLAALATACASEPAPYASGMQTVTLDPSQPGPVQGVGIEGQDIVVMADRMMHDMLVDPSIAGQPAPPRIILDAEYFRNESAQRINTNIIVIVIAVAIINIILIVILRSRNASSMSSVLSS